ncbi:TPA: phage tail fiber protein [Klebsiella quasipneumoniae]
MTVSTQVSRNEYTGNGATTQYDFTFRIFDKSHLLVQTLDTSESIVTLTLGTDYTVTGVNRYNGGKVVLTSALPAGYKISIERSTPVTQEASIRNQGGFFPEIHEDALDKLTMLVQQAYGWWSGLSLRKPSWLANYYDALNNRIRNLRDPSQAQDAATKNYVDGQIVDNTNAWKAADVVLDNKINSNFLRTLRVPESSVSVLPTVTGRKKKLFAWNDSGDPIAVLPESGSAADVLIDLASSDGFSLIGQATYSQIRSFTGSGNSIMCGGCETRLDGGEGIFDQVPGGAVMTTPDDGCVFIRDTIGRLWKRRYEGNEILMAWAGAKSLKQTTDPQDPAFRKCLQAAASLSESGYPQSIIRGLDNATTYLAEKHHIRCGNFPEYMAWKLPPDGGGRRFGIKGTWAQGLGAGWFVVQANHPLFDFVIDNTGIDFNLDAYTDEEIKVLVEDNYILRLEAMVNAPEFNVHAGNHPGTVLYSLGKSDYSAVTAQWPDLTTVLPSIQNVGKAAFNIKHCGRDFLLKNCGAGMGHFHSVWTQDNSQPGYIYSCYDLTLTYEDYVPHTEERGGLIFEACGTLSLENILTGAGGVGHLCIWDCRNVTINKHISICGAPTYAQSNPNLYAVEICNSELAVYGVHAQGSGKFMRIGFNSRVTFYHTTAWDIAQMILGTNDLSLLKYRGQRAAVLNDPIKVFLESGFVQSANTANKGWPCQPLIVFDETIGSDFQLLFNLEANNNHSGYDTQEEALLALIDIRSTSANGEVVLGEQSKLEGNTTNYVVRLANKNQLKDVFTRKTNFVRIRYTDDNSQSSFALRHANHPLQGTVVGRNASYSYPYKRPGLYSVKITIPSGGGSFSVTHNGFTIYEQDQPGIHRVLIDLRFQETVQITINGGETVTMTNAEWRYYVG